MAIQIQSETQAIDNEMLAFATENFGERTALTLQALQINPRFDGFYKNCVHFYNNKNEINNKNFGNFILSQMANAIENTLAETGFADIAFVNRLESDCSFDFDVCAGFDISNQDGQQKAVNFQKMLDEHFPTIGHFFLVQFTMGDFFISTVMNLNVEMGGTYSEYPTVGLFSDMDDLDL